MQSWTISITKREDEDDKPPFVLIERLDGRVIHTQFVSSLARAVEAVSTRLDCFPWRGFSK